MGDICEEHEWDFWTDEDHWHYADGGSNFPPSKRRPLPVGAGPCPQCGGPTVERSSKNGKFYGCLRFPECRGSRHFAPIKKS